MELLKSLIQDQLHTIFIVTASSTPTPSTAPAKWQ